MQWELNRDYLKYLSSREMPVWQQGESLFEEARALHPKSLEEAAAWINLRGKGGPTREERAANLGAILSTQAHFLVERLLDRHARDFESQGGFAERLHRSRSTQRGKTQRPARA